MESTTLCSFTALNSRWWSLASHEKIRLPWSLVSRHRAGTEVLAAMKMVFLRCVLSCGLSLSPCRKVRPRRFSFPFCVLLFSLGLLAPSRSSLSIALALVGAAVAIKRENHRLLIAPQPDSRQ